MPLGKKARGFGTGEAAWCRSSTARTSNQFRQFQIQKRSTPLQPMTATEEKGNAQQISYRVDDPTGSGAGVGAFRFRSQRLAIDGRLRRFHFPLPGTLNRAPAEHS